MKKFLWLPVSLYIISLVSWIIWTFIGIGSIVLALNVDTTIPSLRAYLAKLILTTDGTPSGSAKIVLDGSNGGALFWWDVRIDGELDIDPGHLKNDVILSEDIVNNTIQGIDIKDWTITSADIANGTIQGIDIRDWTITSADIKDWEVKRNDLNSYVRDKIDASYTCSIKSVTSEVRVGYSPITKDPQGDNSRVRRVFRLALANAHDKMWELAAKYWCKEVRLALSTRSRARSYRTSCVGWSRVTKYESHTNTPYVVSQQDRCGNSTRPDFQHVRVYFWCCK